MVTNWNKICKLRKIKIQAKYKYWIKMTKAHNIYVWILQLQKWILKINQINES